MENLKINKKENYAILKLDRGRGNAINMAMMRELILALQELENDAEVRGVVLSGNEGIFSVGLDVKELLMFPDKQGTNEFFNLFGKLVVKMASFPKIMVAAINGHSPAGGCVLAICCDYRVMSNGPYTIGLNEVPVGIMINPLVFGLYEFWIGKRQAYHNFLDGKLCTPDEAKRFGLVDEVTSSDQVQILAEQKLKKWLAHDHDTIIGVKQNVRMPYLSQLIEQSKMDGLVQANDHFWKDTSRQTLMKVIMQLQQKKQQAGK
ncbi:MAG: enoyl-CoA hydratase/isomerase family protein [Bacteroidota bacterium]